MVNWSKSGSKSESWEGIEWYVPEWFKKSDLYGKTSVREKQQQQLMSDKELGAKFGFVHGDAIDKRYNDAVQAKYNEMDAQNRLAGDTVLMTAGAGLDPYLQAIREQKAKGLQSGIMKGSNAATDMSMMLASQKGLQESQQEYQNTMAKLMQERGTATYAAQIDALKERNAVANQMGTLGMQKYGFDVQDEAAYLSYLAERGKYEAEFNKGAATWNASEGQNVRRKTGESSSWAESYDNSAEIAAAAQRDAARINSGSQERIAKMNYDAYMAGQGGGGLYADNEANRRAKEQAKNPNIKADAISGAAPSLSSARNRGKINADNTAYWNYLDNK